MPVAFPPPSLGGRIAALFLKKLLLILPFLILIPALLGWRVLGAGAVKARE
jgi:hypothetical protein